VLAGRGILGLVADDGRTRVCADQGLAAPGIPTEAADSAGLVKRVRTVSCAGATSRISGQCPDIIVSPDCAADQTGGESGRRAYHLAPTPTQEG
jgi:hypothetical protein